MNIQIFGARKSFDTKKAERWFKERRIKYQYIDLDSKGLSPGEYRSIRAAVGYDALVDRDSPDYRELGIDYLLPQAAEEELLANTLTDVLYPADEHIQGKELRLRQQYFFISATVQRVIARFKKKHTDFNELPDKVAFQLNDTHPSMAVAELMRVLVDENDLPWDQAWDITRRVCAYTNHTIMSEALEKWPMELFSRLLPRIYQIVEEINRRFVLELTEKYGNNPDKIRKMAIIADGQIRMAFLAIVGSHSVNGVAALHTEILKKQELHNFYELYPEKFNNKTNGITFRRWLMHANPTLSHYLDEILGRDWHHDASKLEDLLSYEDKDAVKAKLENIKSHNKRKLARFLKDHQGVEINPNSIFDTQIKRLHEYKRQQMNALYVIHKYLDIKAGNIPARPITVLFGGKAAPAYVIAQDIIHLILSLSELINNDPEVSKYLNVHLVENYNVTVAEHLIPATDISEQISLASKEASGTSNMKFMMTGAITLATLDGANIEIKDEVGDENVVIFGMDKDEVYEHYARHDYYSRAVYENSHSSCR